MRAARNICAALVLLLASDMSASTSRARPVSGLPAGPVVCDRFGCRPAPHPPAASARARVHVHARASLSGVVAPLAVEARGLIAACGARLLSGVRRTLIAGTHRLSLHASGRAVDLAGNPRCLYRRLAGWPGGVSIDYGRVHHVHVSYDPGRREWGARFRHAAHASRQRRARQAALRVRP